MSSRKKKVRVAFQKNRAQRTRTQNLTQKILDDFEAAQDFHQEERISGKGELARYRTVIAENLDDGPRIEIDESACRTGRVLQAVGANNCLVQTDKGTHYRCTVRRLVRTLARNTRNAVVAGDLVLFRPLEADNGVIERVEPRRGTISRTSGGKEHVIAANVDQVVIVSSAAQPPLKPALIDRFLIGAEKEGVRPIICINKTDLVDQNSLGDVSRVYTDLGYDVVLTSALTGQGIDHLKSLLVDQVNVLTGQSGVGKSSLISALDPALPLETQTVSADSGKGRHTTRVTRLLPFTQGGWLVDTPGIRQLQLWNVPKEQVEAYFIEFPPFVEHCRFPDCSHTHEQGCRVKQAVESGAIARMRYESYLKIVGDDD